MSEVMDDTKESVPFGYNKADIHTLSHVSAFIRPTQIQDR